MKALIDLEFTGLDNQYISDNEIIQLKIVNLQNDKFFIKNYNSNKKLSAYCQIQHRVEKNEGCDFFSLDEFQLALKELELENVEFWGFGVDTDMKMLSKYGINLDIKDIRTHFQLSEFAYRMATEGSGLEPTYLIVTGEYPPNSSHADISEMELIKRLYNEMCETKAEEYMSVVPFGFAAGMPISEYVENYRRTADGYRFNNSDIFARSLDFVINSQEDL